MVVGAVRPSCLLLLVATLAACDNGAGTGQGVASFAGPGVRPPPPVAVTPVSAYGTVTALGSVSVNGVRYDTSGAIVTVQGRPATPSDLRVGDVVLVVGRLYEGGNQGVADRLIEKDIVRGPIGSIDATRPTLTPAISTGASCFRPPT